MHTIFFYHGKKIKTEENFKALRAGEEIQIDGIKYIVDFVFDDRCYDIYEVELVKRQGDKND